MNENDPRVRKTRRGLRDAFIRLILRKGYDAISIQDIVDEAETARVTFYRHYRDKEELLNDCLNVLYDDLRARTEQITPDMVRRGDSPARVFYDHLEEEEQLYRILFSSRGTQTVIKRMRHHMAQQAMQVIRLQGREPVDIPLEIIAYHAASTQIGLGIWWLDHDRPYTAAYMARISTWLTLAGITRALGLEQFAIPAPPIERREE